MEAGHDRPEEVTEKELVRGEADAVADPGAVMVHPHHALAANAAVVRPRRPDSVTLFAHPVVFEASVLGVQLYARHWLNPLQARLRAISRIIGV